MMFGFASAAELAQRHQQVGDERPHGDAQPVRDRVRAAQGLGNVWVRPCNMTFDPSDWLLLSP